MQVDVLIFGGGVAGLWALDDLVGRGFHAVLLEANGLGSGQTIAAQGIVHGGLKYTLQGLMTRSAMNIREMPGIWRDCLAGTRRPNLGRTRIRSRSCYLWRTESVTSKLGMIGARWGLRAAPQALSESEIPEILAGCPGTVACVDEPVISTASMLEDFLNQHRERILKISPVDGLELRVEDRQLRCVRLTDPCSGQQLEIQPACAVLAAGSGNAGLRELCGLDPRNMQRRPLHMVMVRGNLPLLNGHCVDGAKTRVTITADRDSQGRTVWQVGGQVAELGVAMDPLTLIRHTQAEIEAAIPGIDLAEAEWSTYQVDRAEGLDEKGRRPDASRVLREGNIVTAWPTKMALAPIAAREILELVSTIGVTAHSRTEMCPADWPRPTVAAAPWETAVAWYSSAEIPRHAARAA